MTTKKPYKNFDGTISRGFYVQGGIWTDEEREEIVKQLENCDGIIETFETDLGLSEPGSEERKLWEMRQESAEAGYDRALGDVHELLLELYVADGHSNHKSLAISRINRAISKLRAENGAGEKLDKP